jgi:hypothetical protein
MQTKLQTLKDAAANDNWQKAIAIAARFPKLGIYRNAILDAHGAYTNPAFLKQLGRDIDKCKAAGKLALMVAYGIAG